MFGYNSDELNKTTNSNSNGYNNDKLNKKLWLLLTFKLTKNI